MAMNIDPYLIEQAGRTCYKSEAQECYDIPDDTAEDCKTAGVCGPQCPSHSSNRFIKMRLKSGHHSVLEHSMLTVRFITNRGVTHELVRHRLAAFSQESTRYVNYEKKGLVVIRPVWCHRLPLGRYDGELGALDYGVNWEQREEVTGYTDVDEWLYALHASESAYLRLLELDWRPEQAREVLPNSTKTEIVMTANAREWRHIFGLRTAPAAHPEMRRIMIPLLEELKTTDAWVLFEDILPKEAA
jgi:thymidylate synthase (FAD)